MARDGSGTYTLPATMATANQVAASATVNSIMNDIAQALTDSINKDGSKAFAGNQSMGSNKLTNLAAATTANDAPRFSQVQAGNAAQATTVGGTVDAITLAFTPAITAYVTHMRIRWSASGANTVTAPTVNIDGLGARTIKKNPGGAALAASDIGVSGTICEAVYNGTDFILLNPAAASPTAASDTAAGIVELATTTEVLTGTDAARAVTPDGIAALWEKGADIASAATITIGEGGYFDVTGTTTITDIDPSTDRAGREFALQFDGILTLTHGVNLILPGSANITTAAGDVAIFRSEGADAVRCINYTKASGRAVVEASGGSVILGDIATTSGTSASLGSLNLTAYSFLHLYVFGVSANSGATALMVGNSTADDVNVSQNLDASTNSLHGLIIIRLSDGIGTSILFQDNNTAKGVASFDTALSTATTTITVALSANSFDAGLIRIVGFR